LVNSLQARLGQIEFELSVATENQLSESHSRKQAARQEYNKEQTLIMSVNVIRVRVEALDDSGETLSFEGSEGHLLSIGPHRVQRPARSTKR
jgi:adenylosuccinate synthase